MKFFSAVFLLLSFPVGAETFLPKNNLFIGVNDKAAKGLTEAEYNAVIDPIEKIYTPIVATFGGELKVLRRWKEGAMNASAEQKGKDWILNLYGGMPRFSMMTKDGFSLVVCHELGHHIGGFPRYTEVLTWAAAEGQADYFATTKCLRRVWDGEDHLSAIAGRKVSEILQTKCLAQWREPNEQALCLRIALAGRTIADVLSFVGRRPAAWFERPDQSEVDETDPRHPSPQCRLDTFFQSALCEKSFHDDLTFDSEVTGACHASTGQTVGLRPRCWFKPL